MILIFYFTKIYINIYILRFILIIEISIINFKNSYKIKEKVNISHFFFKLESSIHNLHSVSFWLQWGVVLFRELKNLRGQAPLLATLTNPLFFQSNFFNAINPRSGRERALSLEVWWKPILWAFEIISWIKICLLNHFIS